MSTAEKPQIEELADELSLWNGYREVYRAKGIDIAQLYAVLAREQEQRLPSPGARKDFAELCKDGCLPLALAALTTLLRYSPLLEQFWTELVGHPDNRDKVARSLENAARALENLFGNIIALEKKETNPEFAIIGRLPISLLVSELRFHIKFISFAGTLSADTETHSSVELSKYLLTSYVRQMTGRFHDRSVSGLIGEVVGPQDYSEEAHRMWRNRNYDRIEKHFSGMTRFLVAMSVVIAHTA